MKSLRSLILLPVAALLVALAGCGGGGGEKPSAADVAVVGSQHVTQAMYAAALAEAKASLSAQGQTMPAPGSTGYQQVRTNVVDLLVQRAELALEASKLGITVNDAAVEKKLDGIKKKYYKSDDKQYLAGLKAQGFTDAQFRSFIREQLLETKLYSAITKDASTTKEAERTPIAVSTTTVRTSAGRVPMRSRIEADPVAARTNTGTSRKLRNRGTERVSVTHRATIVATGPAKRTKADPRSRSSGLDPIRTTATATSGIHTRPGKSTTPSIHTSAGMRI
jgi:hypothetical protein